MNQQEFVARLEELLDDISPEERKEALDYYRSYFEDAGIENEQRVIKELESPEKLAQTIKEGLQENVTEAVTVEQPKAEAPEMEEPKTGMQKTANAPVEQKQDNTALIVTLVVVLVVTGPLWLGFLGAVGGICIGIIGAMFGLTVGGLIGGAVCIGVSIPLFAVDVAGAICVLGAGGILIAMGVLAMLLLVLTCGKFIPWVIRGIISLIRSLFHMERKEQRA